VRRYAVLETIEDACKAAGIDLDLPAGIMHREAAVLLNKAWYFAPAGADGGV
jgi:hypothetical protein